jgi:hypothetical protein
MGMERKQINEFIDFGIISLLFIPLAYWGLKKLNKSGLLGRDWKDLGLSQEVKDSLEHIYTDKALLSDFAKILNDEGDVDKLLKKIASQTKRNSFGDWSELSFLDAKTIQNYKFQADAKRISDKLVKTNSYKAFSRRHKFTKKDDEMMKLLFYWIVTRNDFKDTAKDILLGSIKDKNSKISLYDLMPNYE